VNPQYVNPAHVNPANVDLPRLKSRTRSLAVALAPRSEPASPNVNRSVTALLAGLVAEPWGQVSPSVYETGRLVSIAPWLVGHRDRVEFLVDSQLSTGQWPGPDQYAVVPTLSATEALLATLRRADEGLAAGRSAVLAAVNRGLRALFAWFRHPATLSFPDTPAIELIVPTLIARVNVHLAELEETPVVGMGKWRGLARLRVPLSIDGQLVQAVEAALRHGRRVPAKFLHSLEVAGADGAAARGVRPTALGTIGASPAATAAWLGERRDGGPSRRRAHAYLEQVVSRHGGPVPSVLPITTFEQAWVLNSLKTIEPRSSSVREIAAALTAALTDDGVGGGPGLPFDADTTAVTLVALAKFGVRADPQCLWQYEVDTHFCTWLGERTVSPTTNAHVLEALAGQTSRSPKTRARLAASRHKIATWLVGQQLVDGTWTDKWHASPYYATRSCVTALAQRFDEPSLGGVDRAMSWVLDTQRDDGSWGWWNGTAEETAYAMQALAAVRGRRGTVEALARGRAYLLSGPAEDPPLWHDKDLYRPTAVVRAAIIGALQLPPLQPSAFVPLQPA
jgi:halimadienyl-diphosphate synthase